MVTGASGGVGSFAVLLGERLGYHVVASTGRTNEKAFLTALGADEVIDRAELSEVDARALGRVRFGAGVDSVGGKTLANVIRTTRPHGTVTACGLAGGAELELTVYPFILRGVTLAGIDSGNPPQEDRRQAWESLAELVSDEDLATIGHEIALADVIDAAPTILRGEVRGRIVVAV